MQNAKFIKFFINLLILESRVLIFLTNIIIESKSHEEVRVPLLYPLELFLSYDTTNLNHDTTTPYLAYVKIYPILLLSHDS